MGWTLAQSLVSLRAEVNTRWPDRDRASDGSIGDPKHSARASDHNPDDLGIVRAIDIDDNDTSPGAEGIGRVIAEHIRATRPAWVKYLIYHGQICSSYPTSNYPAWAWRPYNGVNAHLLHLHVSVTPDEQANRPQAWGLTDHEEDDMTPGQIQMLESAARDARAAKDAVARLPEAIAVHLANIVAPDAKPGRLRKNLEIAAARGVARADISVDPRAIAQQTAALVLEGLGDDIREALTAATTRADVDALLSEVARRLEA